MRPRAYREALPRALELFRNGHDCTSIASIIGGDSDWWDTLLFAASEYYVDDIQEAVADMKGAGFSVDRICTSLDLNRSDVLAALRSERGVAEQIPRWDKEQQDAVIKDYESGLTIPRLRRKFGFNSNRVALAAVLRMKRSRK